MSINPSAAYKAAMQKNLRPGRISFRATISAENLQFKDAAVLTDNGHLFFSNVQDTKLARRPNVVNTTAETNMYILDGTRKLIPTTPEYQGFVSNKVSRDDSTFAAPPIITITADEYTYDLAGLAIEFDTFNNDYATAFTVQCYAGAYLVRTIEIADNAEAKFTSEERINGINKLVITFLKTHNPNRRIRVLNITFGVSRVFKGNGRSGIISMSHKTAIHPLMTETPQTELEFSFRDVQKEYDPENPTGIWRYITTGQRIQWDYDFVFAATGETETIPGGIFYLKSPPTTQNEDAKFQTTGLLQTLTMLYTEGLYRPGGRTYYDLFNDVLTFAELPLDAYGEPLWRLDESLKNFKCYLPLPNKSVKELIQILCQNTGTIAFENTDGYLEIRPSNTGLTNNPLSLKTAFSYPGYDPQIPPLRSITINRAAVTIDPEIVELHKSSHVLANQGELKISYDASTDQVATVTGGTVVGAIRYFAYGCVLTINPTGDTINVVVNGKKLTTTNTIRNYPINAQGEDAPVNMELLSDDALCDELSQIYAQYLQEVKRYKFEYLGDPSRRSNDLFQIDTRFAKGLAAMVLSSEYSFNNGSRGTLTFKNFGRGQNWFRAGTIRAGQVKLLARRI